MKKTIIFILFSILIYAFSLIPNWDLRKTAINLLNDSNNFTDIFEVNRKNYGYGDNYLEVVLNRTIKKSGTNSSPIIENIVYFDWKDGIKVDWENIESTYRLNNRVYICPTGKHHMQLYEENEGFKEEKPKDFPPLDDWELKCYYNPDHFYMFVSYLNAYDKVFVYKINEQVWADFKLDIHDLLYDFKWTYQSTEENVYPFIGIVKKEDMLYLIGRKVVVKNDNVSGGDVSTKPIYSISNRHSSAFFDNDNYYFYFIIYNNISDFISGYYTKSENMNFAKLQDLEEATINDKNPLQFIDDVTIKKMEFIRNTKYVYYEIYNNDKKITYYGIIDIILNKVIFNTNEIIIKFLPYSSNSMLAITEDSAYRICAISDGNICINSCENSNILISHYKPNYCGTSCEKTSFILFPNNICIEDEDCDETIYYKNNNNECGLCKDIGEGSDYKLINSTGCYKSCPKKSILYI